MIYLDTHVLVRLYLGEVDKLGAVARRAIEEHDLRVSPAAVLELEFLHEIGRLKPNASKVVTVLGKAVGLVICELPFRVVVDYALKQNAQVWLQPFGRLQLTGDGIPSVV